MEQEVTGTSTDGGFGARLVQAGRERGRLCVGIDPHPYLLEQWGLDDTPDGLRSFAMTCVEAFADEAAAVKPQVAFFERFGSRGFAVLEDTLAALQDANCLSIADAKRGDIGSTMAGYAAAWMRPESPLRADVVTVSPYLGVGALQEVFNSSRETGCGVFVLAATSNPEARQVQGATNPAGTTLAQAVVDECASLNQDSLNTTSGSTVGNIGVVVGATVENPPRLERLQGPVLLPGVGAQGAGVEDVEKIMGSAPELGFANVSRGV